MLFRYAEAAFARAIGKLAVVNPFDRPAIAHLEREILGIDVGELSSSEREPLRPMAWPGGENINELLRRAEGIAERLPKRANLAECNPRERSLYLDLILFVLYFRLVDRLQETVVQLLNETASANGRQTGRRGRARVSYFDEFMSELRKFLAPMGGISVEQGAHWFACFFQIRRAYHLIGTTILGNTKPIVRLRTDVWQSVFTYDMQRYRDVLYDRMHDMATLIMGPSGTGKDLVAAAIGQSRYVAFDPVARQFAEDFGGAFQAVNLSALPEPLIESELFGHCRGAFTGAIQDRVGWLERCRRFHCVFLDEIGELSPTIQVKLLRVLQNRTFQRLGETEPRRFEGKVIAATNRDLGHLIAAGSFRRDFYYRLCSDQIGTPSLAEQLRDDPAELPRLVEMLSRRLFGESASGIAEDVVGWIEKELGTDYGWPGNMRELEQCIRNIVVRREYRPLQEISPAATNDFLARLVRVELSADELLTWYCGQAYARTGSFVEAARRLGVDRRTLRRHVAEKDNLIDD